MTLWVTLAALQQREITLFCSYSMQKSTQALVLSLNSILTCKKTEYSICRTNKMSEFGFGHYTFTYSVIYTSIWCNRAIVKWCSDLGPKIVENLINAKSTVITFLCLVFTHASLETRFVWNAQYTGTIAWQIHWERERTIPRPFYRIFISSDGLQTNSFIWLLSLFHSLAHIVSIQEWSFLHSFRVFCCCCCWT